MSDTVFFIVKAFISGLLIAFISTLAPTQARWAALLTALPMMTILSLCWLYLETKDKALMAKYTWEVLIWVIPSLLFFVAGTYLFKTVLPFPVSLLLSVGAMAIGVAVFQKMGIL